ncbi:MAG: class I SAM-dependent rRNA methyltransferase [Planctomycetes bacterium]|nr:class I SAM-dependent rRNA methyltransferase [Planctomycetota bacterium]
MRADSPARCGPVRPTPLGSAVNANALGRALDEAIGRREPLLAAAQTDMLRLFNDQADGIPGLVLDRYGPALIVQLHQGRFAAEEGDLKAAIAQRMQRLSATAAYRKTFAVDRSRDLARLESAHRDPAPWIGAPLSEEIECREFDARFLIRPYDGYSVGLFLDARENRRRVRELSRGRRVLNTFAYTCGFSVAAALGGAAETVSVDVSRRYLEWGKRNFAANGLPLDNHWFYCCDVFDAFRRLERKGRTFDLIILEPPTFARVKGAGTFSIEHDLDRLVAGAVSLLSPQGSLLLATNHRGTSVRRLVHATGAAFNGRRTSIETPPLPAAFAGDTEFSKCIWVAAK